jgi:hypothetical protein
VCKGQQVGVGELLEALQPGLQCFDGRGNLKAIAPEFVSRMAEIFGEECERVDGRQRVS